MNISHFFQIGLPCSVRLRPWPISSTTQFLYFCGQIRDRCGVGVLRGLLDAKESMWQAIKIPMSGKAALVGVTLRSQKPWSSTYRVEKNMLVTLEKKQSRGNRDFNKMPKKEVADTNALCVPNHSIFNLCMRYLEIYKWQQEAAWQAAVCFTCQLQTSWELLFFSYLKCYFWIQKPSKVHSKSQIQPSVFKPD